MAELSRMLEDDKDEWFFQSMDKYKNLYMFELEFPVDTINIIDDTSLFVSGIQQYSKKSEILRLSIPPKLLPKDLEEGLCKDRDFKILNGGYSKQRVLQAKAINCDGKSLVVTYQKNEEDLILYDVGRDDTAMMQEVGRISVPCGTPGCPSKLLMASKDKLYAFVENYAYIWKIDEGLLKAPEIRKLSPKCSLRRNPLSKAVAWDEHHFAYISAEGGVFLEDLRISPNDATAPVFTSSLSLNEEFKDKVLFSFDCIPEKNVIGIIDSCGGYEWTNVGATGSSRTKIPGFEDSKSVYSGGLFNLEYQKVEGQNDGMSSKTTGNVFVVTGLLDDKIQVFCDSVDTKQINCEFCHNGHSRSISHCLWHPTVPSLLFSCSVDCMLHAWQYLT